MCREPDGDPQIVNNIEPRRPITVVLEQRREVRTLESPQLNLLPNALFETRLGADQKP